MTDHTSPTLPEPTDQTRRDRRAMLAAIALAVELPAPGTVSFIDNHGPALLAVHLDTVADGLAWAAHFDAAATIRTRDNGHRAVHVPGDIVWHGWHVLLYASEPAATDAGLDEASTAALRAILGPDDGHQAATNGDDTAGPAGPGDTHH